MAFDPKAAVSERPGAGAADVPEAPDGQLSRLGLRLRVAPVFDLRRRTASTLFCVLSKQESGGALKLGHALLDGLDAAQTAEVDVACLRSAKRYAERLAQSNAVAAVGVAVSLRTLIDPRWGKDYVAELRAKPSPPSNPLMVQVDIGPRGTPMAQLAAAVAQVRQATRYVLLTVPSNGDFMWSVGALGAPIIGINLSGQEYVETVRRLSRALIILCRSQNAVGYLNMLPSQDAVAAAAAAGVRFGTGPALSLTTFTMDGALPKTPVPARSQ